MIYQAEKNICPASEVLKVRYVKRGDGHYFQKDV